MAKYKSASRMISLIGIFVLLATSVFAQEITVSGKIISLTDKQPLPGVSIFVKGTTIGTTSDIDGMYTLKVKKGTDQLRFSCMGYKTLEKKFYGNILNVEMEEDVIGLDAIIAVGYTSKSKAEISSAITTVSSDKLTDISSSDVGSMLQGKVSGVSVSSSSGQPGESAQIRIRGTGSITAQSDPLYVVDGIAGGEFNPNDVESITVLKDAGATAMYGSEAANGVIVVTTKHAAKNEGIMVNLKAYTGIKVANQGNFEMMNGRELYKTQREMMSASLFSQLRPIELASRNFDWENKSFKAAPMSDVFMSVSSGTNKLRYYASIDMYNEDGTFIKTDFRKLSSRINVDADLSDKISLRTSISLTSSRGSYPASYTWLEGAYKNMPWDNPYSTTGSGYVYINSDTRSDNGEKWYGQDKINFLQSSEYNFNRSKYYGMVGDAVLKVNILPGLIFTSSNRVSSSLSKTASYVDTRTNDPSWNNGYVDNVVYQSNSVGTSDLLKANYHFGKHALSGFVGFEYGESHSDNVDASGTNPPQGLSVLNVVVPLDVNGYKIPGKTASFLSQFQYSFENKLFATISYRRDGSSIFGQNNRWGNFPAAAVSWLASQEKFLKSSNILTYLKLRASYGVTGNSNIGAFKYLALYSFSSQYNSHVGAIPVTLSNPDLGWETAYMTNFGIDMEFYHRINLTVDFYNNENKDLLLDVPVSFSSGFDYQTRNAGHVRNRGLEIDVSTVNFNKKFKWNTSFNISFNKNRVMSLPAGQDYILQTVDNVNQKISVGKDMFTWYMPKWAGVDSENGDPLWECQTLDEKGRVVSTELTNDYTKANLQEVGSASPKFTGGFDNNFNYGGFGLSITTNFVYGNKIYNYDRQELDCDGAYPGYNMMKLKTGWSRWEKVGDHATHPKLVMNGNKESNKTSSRYLENGSFLRIRNIKLSYDLPQSWIKSLRLSSAKVYVSGDNLFTFTKFSGTDPEVNMRTEEWQLAGFYHSSYPISRQYMFGIELKF